MSKQPVSAAGEAMPAEGHNSRRGFLRQLCRLPMIGGGLTLIGQPMAVAEPVTDDLLWGYKSWLSYEHRMLSHEIAGYDTAQAKIIERSFFENKASQWHFGWPNPGLRLAGWPDAPQPSTRAALVLSAVGCDWRA